MVRLAAITLAWVSTAPRGTTSTAAVEITANGASAGTSAGAGGRALAVEARERREAGAGALAELVAVRHAGGAPSQSPTRACVEASTTIMAGRARSTTRSTSCGGEPPVDRIGDEALPRAGAVELEVGGVVLGEDADPVARGEPQAGEPGGQLVHPPLERPERQRALALDDRGRVAVDGGAPRDHVVDREGVNAQLSHRLRRL